VISPGSPNLKLPRPVRTLAERLAADGHEAWLVGDSLHELLRGREPSYFALATSATLDTIAADFPRAVQLEPETVGFSLPTRGGPVDLAPYPAASGIEGALAGCDFSVLALAYAPAEDRWLDPHGGLDDLAERRLRGVGDLRARLAEDAVRSVRAARLVAVDQYVPDAACEQALADFAESGTFAIPAIGAQRELRKILLAARPGAALALLRRSGIEERLAPGVAEEAATWVDALPVDLALRLTAWLHGAKAGRVLGRLRFGRVLRDDVLSLLPHHPLEETLTGRGHSSLRRALKRLGDEDLRRLITLRNAQLGAAEIRSRTSDRPTDERSMKADEVARARTALQSLEDALAQCAREIERYDQQLQEDRALAIGGQEVMEQLGWGAGPHIGEALRYLRERVHETPASNTPDALRECLREWASTRSREPATSP